MDKRLFELRKKLKMSQEKLGVALGVTKAGISKIENGERNLTDTMIKLICSTYKVNEIWLRTGEGEMFREISQEEGKALIIEDVMSTENSLRLSFYEGIRNMDQARLELISDIIKSFANKFNE